MAGREKILHVNQDQVRAHTKESLHFFGSSHSWESCPALGKTCDYCQKRDRFVNVCQKRLWDFGRKTIYTVVESEGSNNEAVLLMCSVESSDECAPPDDWNVSLKIADTSVNFKLDLGADCNIISKSLLARLPVSPKQTCHCAKPNWKCMTDVKSHPVARSA